MIFLHLNHEQAVFEEKNLNILKGVERWKKEDRQE
jgi:hypothetical protein